MGERGARENEASMNGVLEAIYEADFLGFSYVHLLPINPGVESIQRIVLAAPRSEPIYEWQAPAGMNPIYLAAPAQAA
jgi:hypothetical protein